MIWVLDLWYLASIREQNVDMLNELMNLAATVNDVSEFERKLDEPM